MSITSLFIGRHPYLTGILSSTCKPFYKSKHTVVEIDIKDELLEELTMQMIGGHKITFEFEYMNGILKNSLHAKCLDTTKRTYLFLINQ